MSAALVTRDPSLPASISTFPILLEKIVEPVAGVGVISLDWSPDVPIWSDNAMGGSALDRQFSRG